ncbi:glycosyltransferase family 2 protein [Nostoc sp. UHCC 0870]|uniref:glycosyltransferase family 2 protein n=1 Tax=Nostoc sp. UHCC 0870 TaxID=2914041 RepID=UPI001EDF6B70|nr:glycosyltransferase family 2 protein [Nostoc sp. UHCC 0870]UKO99579.1 glycosyltransferase family 2 protein [Nostoc sp. UHCC 0870]
MQTPTTENWSNSDGISVSMLEQITPLILTYNEEPNIGRTLQCLTWAKQIIVIDSYSTDTTLEILNSYSQVQLFQRKFDTHGQQWNYGLEQVQSPWVLSLDADYIVTDELISEMATLPVDGQINGYFASFKYCIFGKPVRNTRILPPRQVLFQKSKAIYIDDGHTQVLQLTGQSALLSAYLYHDDRKPFSRWLWSQERYTVLESKKILETPINELDWVDRIRRQKVLAPWMVFLYCLIIEGWIFDGWHGWYYVFQRVLAETILAIRLIEREKLKNK